MDIQLFHLKVFKNSIFNYCNIIVSGSYSNGVSTKRRNELSIASRRTPLDPFLIVEYSNGLGIDGWIGLHLRKAELVGLWVLYGLFRLSYELVLFLFS